MVHDLKEKLKNNYKSHLTEFKIADTKKQEKSIAEAALFGVPQQVQYNLSEVFYDLLSFAVEHLIEGGRLVYWLPIFLAKDRSKMT